jgi:hypothetical protein
MVKLLTGLCLVLSIISCGAARRPANGLDIPDPGEGVGDEIVQSESDDTDRAQREFEIAAYVADNPIDPSVVETERQSSMLESRRERVATDRGHPVRATCRLTKGMISTPGRERSDGYLALSAERWKALLRGRRAEDTGDAVSCYVSGSAFSGAVRLHAGSFVPDFALGLVFGGSGGSSLSSSAFPFRSPRRIVGTASFFLRTLHGAAAEIRHRNIYAAVFGGRTVTYGTNGPEAGEKVVSGARVEARLRGAEIGFSGSTGAWEAGEYVCAIDGRWRSDRMNAGIEIGFDRSGETGVLSGFSCRVPGTRAALLLYAVPPGAAGIFGAANGRAPGRSSSICGAAAVVEREVFQRVRARASIDRYERIDGFHETARQTTRIECERRGRRSLLRLSWIRAGEERRNVIPCPPEGEGPIERSQSLNVLSECRIGRKASIGVALKRIEDGDGLGWLVSPILRANLFSARVRIAVSCAAYRTAFGDPACYYSEPSLAGSFPLRIASHDIESGAIIIGYIINGIGVFIHAALEDGRAPEISLQASAGL